MTVEFQDFVRRPFKIKAVQITDENMDELCKLIGLEVKQKGNSRIIIVDRRIVPMGTTAKVGHWVTQMEAGDMPPKLRCYPNKIFNDQFMSYSDDWSEWFTETVTETPSESSESTDDETFKADTEEPYVDAE